MSSKILSAGCSSEIAFLPESARRTPQKTGLKGFVIALLLCTAFFIFFVTMLVRYPQKVDAFLNSDEGVESRHVMTSHK